MASLNHNRPLSSIAPAASLGPVLEGRSKVYLLPGDLHVTAEPCQLTTILGSCVAVCLWDRQTRIGGMNHFILPAWREGEGPSTRFGDLATVELLRRLMSLGCRQRSVTAKLFGGAALFRPEARYEASLGAKNVETARLLLKNASISVVAEDVGGSNGRKIIFNSDDGSVWSRPV
jgi:chemotaxis protein CheD